MAHDRAGIDIIVYFERKLQWAAPNMDKEIGRCTPPIMTNAPVACATAAVDGWHETRGANGWRQKFSLPATE